DTDALLQRRVQWHIDRRDAPRHRERRAGQERKAKPPRLSDHLDALAPVGGKMLVVEHGHGTPARLEYLHDFLEEFVARVAGLAFLIARILAVLADNQDPIDGES